MDVRSFPKSGSTPGVRADAVDIELLLTLTNTRLARLTGSPDVIATRLGLRHLRKLGMTALVYGTPTEADRSAVPPCANDEAGTGT